MKLFEVGGCVRDELLGLKSKDVDFTIVLPDTGYVDPFRYMVDTLKADGFEMIDKAEKPEFVTARGFFPKNHSTFAGKPADFVLARKESGYSDGRHPDKVEIGTLEDDLARRDFTMNAIAKDGNGFYIDPHGGREDIERRLVRAVGDPLERLSEDPLRALRAIRFAVTKGFNIDPSLRAAMTSNRVIEGVVCSVSDERITEELSTMFRYDTVASLLILSDFPALMSAAFCGNVSLDSTMKTKGRPNKVPPSQKKASDKPAYNGCQCLCHRQTGVMHMAACCRPDPIVDSPF